MGSTKGRGGMARALNSCRWGQGHGGGSRSDDGEDIIVIKAIREDHSMRVWDACQWDAGCGMCGIQDAGCGMRDVWDAQDAGCGMQDGWDVGCVGCSMWDAWDVGCVGCS